MSVTFPHHRFGRGAARLALGRPMPLQGLASAAQERAPFERALVACPPLLGLALAIGLSVVAVRILAPIEETPLPKTMVQLDAWEVPQARPELPAAEEFATSHIEKPLTPRAETKAQPAADSAPETPHRVPFDPRSLVTTASPSIEIPDVEPPLRSFPQATQRRAVAKARHSAAPDIELPRVAPHQDPLAEQGSHDQNLVSSLEAHRPSSHSAPALQITSPNGPEQSEREKFLSAHAIESNGSRGSGTARRTLPPVALAKKDLELEDKLSASSHGPSTNGQWHAVPLDELPDCSPPGRQDQLKQQILAAAPEEATCESQDGSFRFLETRNLNAFLMWSRTHPADRTGSKKLRDVCDVLERALRCLGEPSTQELRTR